MCWFFHPVWKISGVHTPEKGHYSLPLLLVSTKSNIISLHLYRPFAWIDSLSSKSVPNWDFSFFPSPLAFLFFLSLFLSPFLSPVTCEHRDSFLDLTLLLLHSLSPFLFLSSCFSSLEMVLSMKGNGTSYEAHHQMTQVFSSASVDVLSSPLLFLRGLNGSASIFFQ